MVALILGGLGALPAPVALARPAASPSVVGSVFLGNNAGEIAVNPSTDRVYVARWQDNNTADLKVVDVSVPGSPTVVATLSGGWGAAANPTTNRFYTSDGYGGNILVYDGSNNTLLATVNKGYCHPGIDVDSTTNLVYFASQCGSGNDPLHVLNGATNAIAAGPIGSGGVAWGIRVNPTTGRAYFNANANTRAFGPSPGFAVKTDLANMSIQAVNPVTNRLYFRSGSDLQVRDGTDHSLIATISGAGGPAAVNTSLNRIYVVDGPNQVIKVIDGATNSVLTTFSLGTGVTPQRVAVDSTKNRIYALGTSSGISLYVVSDTMFTWTAGGADTNWTTAANWSGGAVPTPTDTVVLANAAATTITMDTNVTLAGLTISGSGVTLSHGSHSLAINGNFSQADGTFTGGSTFTLTGNWSRTGGTFNHGNGTVVFGGSTGQTISGSNTFYDLTINNTGGAGLKVDALGSTLTVLGLLRVQDGIFKSATSYNNVTIDAGATLELSGDIAVSGNFTNSGNFTHNGGTVAFDGATTQSLTANVATVFNNVTVAANTVLVETVADDNVTVSGTLTNNGTIRKSQSVSSTGTRTFGLTGVSTNVSTQGGLTSLQVDRVDANHGSAPTAGLQTGKYWAITPTGDGYTVDLTLPIIGSLPHSGADDAKAQVCHWDGSGSSASDWDCARTSSTASSVTRTGITGLSDWVVGDPEADVSASKADSPDPVLVNQTLSYTPYTVTNNGPFPATNVALTDTLPAGVSNVSASADLGGNCGVNALVVTCTWATLASGSTSTVTLTVTAPGSPQNIILNQATVSRLEYDPVAGNNNTTSGTTVINPAPGTGAMRFSATWWTGSLTLDANANGVTTDTVDRLYYSLTDTDSDGVYDRLDLSLGDATFDQASNLTNSAVSTTGDDERRLATDGLSKDITLGARLFTVDFVRNPGQAGVTADVSITSKTWYKGTFTADLDAGGSVNDTVNFVLIDTDSDGLYEAMDLSTNDTDYGDGNRGDQITGSDNDESIASGENVRLGDFYTFTVSFVNNPSGATGDASITSKTWFTGTFNVDVNADGTAGAEVSFVLGDTDSDGRYDTMDISTDNATFGTGTLSGQSPRRTGTNDDERLDRATGTGGSNDGNTAGVDIRLGANYLFTVAFDNNPAAPGDNDDARITALTHYEGSFRFDADRNGLLESDGSNTVYFGLTDTDSNGLYDTMDLSLADQTFGQGDALANAILKPGDDERFGIASIPWRFRIGTDTTLSNNTAFTVDASFVKNPPAGDQDAQVLHIQPADVQPMVYTALNSWQIDADGDTVADDHVFFVLSATGSTGVIDTIDISIGNLTFGQNVNGGYASADGATDARFSGACPCSHVVKLGTHYFLVEFFSDVLARTDDARITSRWYVGTFPVDVDNDQLDNTIDFVLVDPDSDGIYTVIEIDGDDSGAYSAAEVHKGAGVRWSNNPRRAASTGNVGTHTAIAATDVNTIFIAYHDEDNGDLKFTRSANAGLDWSTPVTIDGAGDAGKYASLVAVNASTLLVAYYDASNGDLKVARTSDGGSTWTAATVDSAGDVGQYTSIGVDANTLYVYVSYYDATNGDLKVAKSTDGGSTWTPTTVDSGGDVGRYTSLAVLPDNKLLDGSSVDDIGVYISYYDATNKDLKFVRSTNSGATWITPVTVDSANDVGQFSSIRAAYDTTPNDDTVSGDTVFISFYDATSKDLKFARTPSGGDTPGEWTVSTIDSAGDVGQYTSLFATEDQTVFIAYYDSTPGQLGLKSITSTNGGLTFGTPVVVDSGNVGRYVSLTGIQVHTLFASYYDAQERDLKFVKSVLLVDLEGHRMSVRYNFNPTVAGSAVLKDGRIIRVAQLNRDQWLFNIPRDAEPGPNIEQSQIRVKVQATGEVAPGFYDAKLTIQQVQ